MHSHSNSQNNHQGKHLNWCEKTPTWSEFNGSSHEDAFISLTERHPDPKMSCHYLNLQNKESPYFQMSKDSFGERYWEKLNLPINTDLSILQQEYTEAEERTC